jgi:hypothetical protein
MTIVGPANVYFILDLCTKQLTSIKITSKLSDPHVLNFYSVEE